MQLYKTGIGFGAFKMLLEAFNRAIPVVRDQVKNWIDFSKAIIGGAGPISPIVHRQNYELIVHCRLQLS